MSGSGGVSRRPRLGRLGVVGSRPRRGRAGWRRTRFVRVCPSSTSRRRWAVARVRSEGAGRPAGEDRDPGLLDALRALVGDDVRGDPERVLLWTSKSVRNLAEELGAQGHQAGKDVVARLLKGRLGFSLQSRAENAWRASSTLIVTPSSSTSTTTVRRRSRPGSPRSVSTPRRRSWSASSRTRAASGIPRAGRRGSTPTTSRAWPNGKAIPYGVYDIADDSAMVSVGIDRDTAQFSVAAIRRGGSSSARPATPSRAQLVTTADCGGSNGNRTRLWKTELQTLADVTGLEIVVCHFPPGTSKWNKIEHRLFSFISRNWRGQSLISYEVIINLIAATTPPHRARGLRAPRPERVLPRSRSPTPTGRREHRPRRVPRRMELLDQSLKQLNDER